MKAYSKNIHGIIFNIIVEESLYPQAQSLFQVISAIPPEKLRNGFKIEIGFSVFILVENTDGYSIVVPDYTKNPFSETTNDLTIALWIQLEQTDLLRLYNISGESVRFDDKIAVAKNVLQENLISLQRFSDLGESGWCVNGIEQNENGKASNMIANEYESYYTYQLLNVRPELIKILALPYDYIVVFEGDTIVEILNEQNESIVTQI